MFLAISSIQNDVVLGLIFYESVEDVVFRKDREFQYDANFLFVGIRYKFLNPSTKGFI
jgi:hypothetical protein